MTKFDLEMLNVSILKTEVANLRIHYPCLEKDNRFLRNQRSE